MNFDVSTEKFFPAIERSERWVAIFGMVEEAQTNQVEVVPLW